MMGNDKEKALAVPAPWGQGASTITVEVAVGMAVIRPLSIPPGSA